MEVRACSLCEGIAPYWDKEANSLVAPYVEGGSYCDCPDELLDKLKQIM